MKVTQNVKDFFEFVTSTMGPGGKYVAVYDGYKPHVTKDGVTVAKSWVGKSTEDKVLIDIIKEAAVKVGETVGDGTTTSIAFVEAFIASLESKTHTLEDLKEFITEASNVINTHKFIPEIKELKETLKVSVNGDLEMTELLSEVIDKVGPEGTVKINKSLNGTDYVNYSTGLEFPTGMVSKYFMNDSKRRLFTSKDCQVILCNDTLDTFSKLESALNGVDNKKAVLILCNDISENNIYTLVSSLDNFPEGICVCKMPSYQRKREEDFEDMLHFGGCDSEVLHFGEFIQFLCEVEVSDKRLILQNGEGECGHLISELQSKLNHLTELNTNQTSDNEQIKALTTRINRLKGHVAEVFIGAETDAKILEKIDRVDDGLKAVHSAHKYGVIPGGGLLIPKYINPKFELIASAIKNKIVKNSSKTLELDNNGYYANVYDPAKATELSLKMAYEIVEVIVNLRGVVVTNNDINA